MFEVVTAVNPVLSETWNSYVRAPVWSDVAFLTMSSGRRVSSW